MEQLTLNEFMKYYPNFSGYADQDHYPNIFKEEEEDELNEAKAD